MSKTLSVLMVEDSEDDVQLTIRALKKGGYNPVYKRVENAEAMRAALREKTWDVILCDYQMPQFNGLEAIVLLKKTAIDIPIIIVSGAIGEETAADCMRFGAQDYVMKGNLSRLVPAIQRELKEAEARSKLNLAENALRGSEKLLRHSQAISKIGGWAHDVEKKRTTWTDEVYRIYGIGEDGDFIDFEKSMSFYSEKDQSIIEQAFMNVLQAGEPYDLELRSTAADGIQKWIRTTGVPVFEDGKITEVVGSIMDITDRKQAEEALRKSEEYFRALTESSSDIILVVDKKGTITYASPSVDHILGLKPEELMGKSSLDLIVPEDFQRAVHDFGKAILTEGILVPNAFRVSHKDGSERVLEGVGKNLFKNPSVAGFVMNVRDVTDHRRAEQAIRESEEKYRTIIETMQEGYYEVDIKGNLTFFNESMREILGYAREELLGMNNRQYLDEENASRVYQVHNRIYRTGEPVKNLEWQIVRKDGNGRDLEVSISLIRDGGGACDRFPGHRKRHHRPHAGGEGAAGE